MLVDFFWLFFGGLLGGILLLSVAIPLLKWIKLPRQGKLVSIDPGNEEEFRGQQEQEKWERIVRFIFLALMLAIAYKLIAISFYGVYESTVLKKELSYIALIYSYAWLSYIVMGVFWALGKRIWKVVPLTGTVAGTVGVITTLPLILPVFYLVPHVLFAQKLAKFHLYGKP